MTVRKIVFMVAIVALMGVYQTSPGFSDIYNLDPGIVTKTSTGGGPGAASNLLVAADNVIDLDTWGLSARQCGCYRTQ